MSSDSVGRRVYRTPAARAKDRFQSLVNDNSIKANATIEKHDIVISFPITEGPFLTGSSGSSGTALDQRISWADASTIWRAAIPGTDEAKQRAVAHLATHWEIRTGIYPRGSDAIRRAAWFSVAREAIVDQLSKKSGLSLKLEGSTSAIYCLINAPIKLLEMQADLENYRLEFRGEIDPGSEEFWNREVEGEPVELIEAKKPYSRDEANIILERLYECGKISAHDLSVFHEENQEMWSKRLHALERIADQVPVWNEYPTYVPFSTDPHLRYLFRVYPTTRGPSLFRPKDRLFLTKAILDKFFDLEMLSLDGVITAFTPLHDANRGETVTIELLRSRWVSFWRVRPEEVGVPTVTSKGYNGQESVSWYIRPFCQPLADIRDYFGEKVALYFAWLGFYTWYLLIPAFIGVVVELIYTIRGYVSVDGQIDYVIITFVCLTIGWNIVYRQAWDRECSATALRWGTRGFEVMERTRPQFEGDTAEPLRRSNVTNAKETFYPPEKRYLLQFWSLAVVLVLVVLNMILVAAIFYGEYLVVVVYPEYEFSGFTLVVNFVQALQIVTLSTMFRWVARPLNDLENHRTETVYDDSLISKILLFQLFNNFAAPLFTAFGKNYFLESCEVSCLYDLQQMLYVIIALRTTLNIYRLTYPFLAELYKSQFERSKNLGLLKGMSLRKSGGDLIEEENLAHVEELKLEIFHGTFDDYSQAVIQYGYICFFSNAVPLLPLISLLENLLKLRMDAFRLCSLTRRPFVQLAEDTGMWGSIMNLIAILGVVCSVGVICFTLDDLNNYSTLYRGIIFFVAQQALFLIKFFLEENYPPTLEWVENVAERNAFIEDAFVKGVTDDDEGGDVSGKGNVDFAMKIPEEMYDIRKLKQFTEEEYAEMEECENTIRDLEKEMRLLRDQLLSAYKYETFNENTGVGETKHGLPLGRLSVKILELQNLMDPAAKQLVANLPIRVRVVVKGYRQTGTPAGPPVGPNSDTQVRRLDETGRAAFHQVMGPYAPIRTVDADIVFDVIDSTPNSVSASIATASIKLRELLDQKTHNEVINLRIRCDDGTLKSSSARLFVTLLFHYSKVVPVRNQIYSLQDKIRTVEKRLNLIKDRKNDPKDD